MAHERDDTRHVGPRVSIYFVPATMEVDECAEGRFYIDGDFVTSNEYDLKIRLYDGLSFDQQCTDQSEDWPGMADRSWYSRDYRIWACNDPTGRGRVTATMYRVQGSTLSQVYTTTDNVRITTPSPTATPTTTTTVPQTHPPTPGDPDFPRQPDVQGCKGAYPVGLISTWTDDFTTPANVRAVTLANVYYSFKTDAETYSDKIDPFAYSIPLSDPPDPGIGKVFEMLINRPKPMCAYTLVSMSTSSNADLRVSGTTYGGTQMSLGQIQQNYYEVCDNATECYAFGRVQRLLGKGTGATYIRGRFEITVSGTTTVHVKNNGMDDRNGEPLPFPALGPRQSSQ